MRPLLRFLAAFLLGAALPASAAYAQGNCSNGTWGVRIGVSRTMISGDTLMICYTLQGNPAEQFRYMRAHGIYNNQAVHPLYDPPPYIPPGNPYNTPPYRTMRPYCLGGPQLCPTVELWITMNPSASPYLPFPMVPVEFICERYRIMNASNPAGIRINSIMAERPNGSALPACPPGDHAVFNGPLPVELTRFDATVSGRDVVLAWETASETNNAGFEVQVQRGAEWATLAFVEGHGTTTEANTYSYTASRLLPGAHAFRLRQVDYDGQSELLGPVEADIETPGSHFLTQAYPNPFNPLTSFTLSVARSQRVTVAVYDALGREVTAVFDGVLPAHEARTFTLDAAALPSGLYLVRARGETFAATRPVTLAR